jgi:anti-sigma regulatory factor (Ser/Thr protein kinase)
MRITGPDDARHMAGLRLMRPAIARMVAALRGGVGVAAVTSGLLAGGAPLSWWILAPALAIVAGWTACYVTVAWTRGLRNWLVGTDLLLVALLCLAIGHLVPPTALAGSTSWVSLTAAMAVVSAQLAGKPVLWLPVCLVVAGTMMVGSRLAHSPDGGEYAGGLMVTQSVLTAMVMVIVLRAERSAVKAFADLEEAQAAAMLAAARREDERAQLRMVHNGPLTILTMAFHAGATGLSAILQQRAAEALEALRNVTAVGNKCAGETRLDERLAKVTAWYEALEVAVDLQPCLVPADIADAFAGAVAEALENVVRYAGTQRAAVLLRDQQNVVRVTVADQGRGFEPALVSGLGFGLREDLAGRMAAARASSVVRSQPGAGTEVQLEWARG